MTPVVRGRFHSRATAAVILMLIAAGCSREPINLSPLASDDPARHQRAIHEEQDVARANREGEARVFARLRQATPEPEPQQRQDTPSGDPAPPSPTTTSHVASHPESL
jgi:hypothetical protein